MLCYVNKYPYVVQPMESSTLCGLHLHWPKIRTHCDHADCINMPGYRLDFNTRCKWGVESSLVWKRHPAHQMTIHNSADVLLLGRRWKELNGKGCLPSFLCVRVKGEDHGSFTWYRRYRQAEPSAPCSGNTTLAPLLNDSNPVPVWN